MLSQVITGLLFGRYNEVHKLHRHCNDALCNLALYHTDWYYD